MLLAAQAALDSEGLHAVKGMLNSPLPSSGIQAGRAGQARRRKRVSIDSSLDLPLIIPCTASWDIFSNEILNVCYVVLTVLELHPFMCTVFIYFFHVIVILRVILHIES